MGYSIKNCAILNSPWSLASPRGVDASLLTSWWRCVDVRFSFVISSSAMATSLADSVGLAARDIFYFLLCTVRAPR